MYHVGVDIGGAFTDYVLVDGQENDQTAKVLSTRGDPVTGGAAGAEPTGRNRRHRPARPARPSRAGSWARARSVCRVFGVVFRPVAARSRAWPR
jgi:hypothetical protein